MAIDDGSVILVSLNQCISCLGISNKSVAVPRQNSLQPYIYLDTAT